MATQALAEASRRHGRAGDALRHARALRQLAGPEHPAQLAGEVLALQQADRLDDAGLLLAAAGPAARAWPELAGAQLWQELALGQLAQAEVSAAALAELGRELDRPADQELAQAARLVIALLREGLSAGHGLVKNGKENHDGAASGRSDAAGVGGWRSGLAVVGGWLVLAQGRPAEGVAAARWALRAARSHGAPWLWQPGAMRLVAQLGLVAGDQKLAHEAAAVAELAAARNPQVPVFGGLACQVRGLAQGDASLLGRAWELLRSSPRPLLRASAAQDYGTALLTGPGAGSRAAGVRLLDEAWDGFGQAGAWAARQAAERTLRQAGVRRAKWAAGQAAPPWPARGWDALTDAERKVAELVSSGHTNRSAASQLGLSPNTVGTHVRSIFSKLHIQSRVQLANLRHEQLTAAASVGTPSGRGGGAGSAAGQDLPGGLSDLGVGEGVPADTPAAVRRLGDQHPGALAERRVTGRGRRDLGHLPDHAELLVPVQHADRGQHGDPDVGVVAAGVAERIRGQLVHERGGVVGEERDVRHGFPAHHARGQVLGQLALVAERPGRGGDIDHRHGRGSLGGCWWMSGRMAR